MKGKSKATIILSVLLVMSLAVGGTLAWLTVMTNQENNAFNVLTAGDDLNAILKEPAWTTGVQTTALKMVPGKSVPKDPQIENTSIENLSEWAGIKLTFTKGDGVTVLSASEMIQLNKVIDITISSDWERKVGTGDFANQEIYYYKNLLAKGASTTPLFTEVRFKTTAVNADMDVIKKNWNGFKIVINGAVVQGEVATTFNADVKTELDKLIKINP